MITITHFTKKSEFVYEKQQENMLIFVRKR